MSIATLPMYDLAEISWATDAWWVALATQLRARGVAAPATLAREVELTAGWSHESIVVTQICGRPLMMEHRRLTAVASPSYAFAGCGVGTYRSFLVAREGSAWRRPRRVAVNDFGSHSGWSALLSTLPSARDAQAEASGSHLESLRWVKEGRAEVAAIDCVTFGLLAQHRPEALAGVAVVARSAPAPAPPFAVSDVRLRESVLAALKATMTDPSLSPVRDMLGLVGVAPPDHSGLAAVAELARRTLPPRG